MSQTIVHVAVVIRDYGEAIAVYTKILHLKLVEITYQPEQDKRWQPDRRPYSIVAGLFFESHCAASTVLNVISVKSFVSFNDFE